MNEKQMQIADCCCKKGHEEAARSLLLKAVAAEPDVSSIKAYLPDRHALQEWFIQYGKGQIETSAMWKIIDIRRLLTKLAPELSQQMRQSSKESMLLPAALLMGLHGQEMVLRVRKEEVEVVEASAAAAYHISLEMNGTQTISDREHFRIRYATHDAGFFVLSACIQVAAANISRVNRN